MIRRVSQRGAFVCPAGPAENPIDWSSKISRQAHLLDEPVLEMLAQNRLPDLRYRLSAGTPALSCFPVVPFRKAMNKVWPPMPRWRWRLLPPKGQPRLRRASPLSEEVESRSHPGGGRGAGRYRSAGAVLDRASRRPRHHRPADLSRRHPGLRAAGARLVEWTRRSGRHEVLERLLIAYQPKFIFTMPTYHNPTARTMDEEQRRGC